MPVRTGDIWDPPVWDTVWDTQIDGRFQFPLNIDEEDARIDEKDLYDYQRNIVNDLRSTCERIYAASIWDVLEGKPIFRSDVEDIIKRHSTDRRKDVDKILDVDENGWNDVLNM